MKIDVTQSRFFAFIIYTGLGYLALMLHHGMFYPNLGIAPSALSLALVLVNLLSGAICFGQSLRILFSWWRAASDGS